MSSRALQILAAASIGSALLAGTAAAQTTQINWNSSVFGDGSEAMTLNITSDSNFKDVNQSFGGLSGTFSPVPIGDPVSGATNLLWCTDIPQQFTPGQSYQYNVLPITTSNPGAQYQVNPPTTATANQITNILYNAEANSSFSSELGKLTPGSSTQSIWSAAVQLAIWAMLYDSPASYSLSAGNFFVSGDTGDGVTAVTDAQAMINCVVGVGSCSSLAGWASSTPSGYGTYQFTGTAANPTVQSVGGLLFTSGGGTNGNSVPEPPSIALLAAGLLALPLLRRRRAAAVRKV